MQLQEQKLSFHISLRQTENGAIFAALIRINKGRSASRMTSRTSILFGRIYRVK
ncbi:hypothetical protein SK128_025343, partial [Halocaridina rubra]